MILYDCMAFCHCRYADSCASIHGVRKGENTTSKKRRWRKLASGTICVKKSAAGIRSGVRSRTSLVAPRLLSHSGTIATRFAFRNTSRASSSTAFETRNSAVGGLQHRHSVQNVACAALRKQPRFPLARCQQLRNSQAR